MLNEYKFICKQLGSRRVILIIDGHGYAFGDMATELRGRIGTHLWLVEESAHIGVALTVKRSEEIAELLDCYLVGMEDEPHKLKWKDAFQRALTNQRHREVQSKIRFR